MSDSIAKACTSCARSKAKCDWTSGVRCHRCTRLNKDCKAQESIRKRKPPKLKRAAQIAVLEEKVNGLLNTVGGRQTSDELSSQTSSSAASLEKCLQLPTTTLTFIENGHNIPQSTPDPAIRSMIVSPYTPNTSPLEIGTDDAMMVKGSEACLSIFQNRLAARIPFVVIPSTMRAESLRTENPFIYMAVTFVASYESPGTQILLGKRFLDSLMEKLIMRGEKSLDMLQGLLIYLSWNRVRCTTDKCLSNTLLAMTMALFVDLGLKRVSAENEVNETFMKISQKRYSHSPHPRQLNADEKRAVLGCYYLSSTLTSCFSKMDSLRFTPYIHDCCESLRQESDVDLACLLQLQSLVEKQRLSGLWELVQSQDTAYQRTPAIMLVKSCQDDLLNFKSTLSSEQLSNPFFAMHYYSAEIHLYEACFQVRPTTRPDYSMSSFRLTDIIQDCFLATLTFFEIFLSIPFSDYFTLTLISFGQLFHALGALYNLSTTDNAEWDKIRVRTTLNFSDVLNQICNSAEQAASRYGEAGSNNPWISFSGKLKFLQSGWEAKLANETNIQQGIFEDFQAMIDIDFLDDDFWRLPPDPVFLEK